MKVKELNPKYKIVEVMITNHDRTKTYKKFMCSFVSLVSVYGDLDVLSCIDFKDTKTTHIIIEGKLS